MRRINVNKLKGGKGDKTDPSSLNQKELKVGVAVEKEHTSDTEEATEIATDHLSEIPNYYLKLIKAGLVDEPKALKKAKKLNIEMHKSIKNQLLEKSIIKEDLTRSDIELIKRLILSAFEGWLQNLFTRRSMTLTGISWKESRDKKGNLIREALKKSELTDIEDATHMGGIHPKYIGVDKLKKKHMAKPSDLPFGPWADYAASKIAKQVNPNYPATRVRNFQGSVASEQEMLNAAPYRPENPIELSKDDLRAIVQDAVLNWMLGNHDANKKQFIRNEDGQLIGIDKTQSFKFYGKDKLDINYWPNNSRPYINIVLEAWRDGLIDLDPKDFGIAIKKIQQIPDDKLRRWVYPYATEVEKAKRTPGERDNLIKMILERKHNLLKDYTQFLSKLMNKNIQLESVIKEELENLDQRYMSAIKENNMELVNQIVKEAANSAGYTIGPVYHGSKSDSITIFKWKDSGIWFANDKSNAEPHGHETPSRVYEVFLSPKRIYEPTEDEIKEWTRSSHPLAYTRKLWTIQHMPDTIKVKEYAWVVFDPRQIKLADSIIYDKKGNIIPLSKRFNSSSKKITESTDNTVDGLRWQQAEVSFSVLSTGDVLFKWNQGYDLMLNDEHGWIGNIDDYARQKGYKKHILMYNAHNIMKSMGNDLNYKVRKSKRVLDGRFWYGKDYDIVAFRGQRENVFKYHNIWFNFLTRFKDHDQIYLDIPKSGKPVLMTWEQLSQKQATHQDKSDQIKQSDEWLDKLYQRAGIHEVD